MKVNVIVLIALVVVATVVAIIALGGNNGTTRKSGSTGDGPPNEPGPYLMWTLDSKSFDLQFEGMIAGGSLPGSLADDMVEKALLATEGEYDSWELAAVAFYVLAGKGKPDLVPKIRELIEQSDDDWDVGAWAARAAGRIPGADSLKLLVDLSMNEDEDVRRAAAEGLARRKDPEARDALKNLLDDEDDEVRCVAAGGLVGFDDPDAAAVVEELLGDDDEDWDAGIAAGLAAPDNLAAETWIDVLMGREWEEPRMSAARALGVIGGEMAITRLEKLLEDEEPDVRVVAAAALAKNRKLEKAVPILVEAVRERDAKADGELRVEALKALVALGRSEDLALFEEIFGRDQDTVGYRILRAWAAHGIIAIEGE